ncbi:MAG TPA: cysteine--tRNA ligase [Candidatus Paceibacterota bacterium]|nr:cysteine--tRNA ligase [Candidatus Paceibacterota bacterium]
MWPFGSKTKELFFTNSLTGKKELFVPLRRGRALLYSCGPTVYGPVQIGNLRSFILADLAARALTQAGYRVQRVMNVTDVGHLVGDGDEGEDKMAVGAKREATTPEAIADRYTKQFLEDIAALNIETPQIRFPRASEYIAEDIEMIELLSKKGYTYTTADGVYFDTSKFPSYGELGGLKHAELQAGARVAVGEKRSPHDFVLWRAAKQNDLQQWDSPWGKGNPGWSIECSAMATELLGSQIDIHTGGEDLAAIHHNNEIAQSECSSGKTPFVKYWLHGAFLNANGEKLSKSLGNSFTLGELREKGFHPLSLRYLFLQAHYRSPLSFTLEALTASQEALTRLWRIATDLGAGATKESAASRRLAAALRDDLGTPQALALLWEALQNHTLSADEKRGVLTCAEAVFGLSLLHPPKLSFTLAELPEDIQTIAKERESARAAKDYARSDELRIHLQNRGYAVEDTASGPLFTSSEKE